MKKIYKILNHANDKKLLSFKSYKERMSVMQKLFKEYHIAGVAKDEYSFYQLEIIYESLLNKMKFESRFLETFVQMHDFWKDLDYQERKHQMNVDIDQMRAELKSFPFDGEEIYMPMFDKRMNHLYTEEIVLLELKQYGRYTREFADEVKENLYGILPYQYNFTSCLYIGGNNDDFCIYNPGINRLYFIKEQRCVITISFDPTFADAQAIESIQKIVQAVLANQPLALIDAILEANVVKEKTMKKLQKYATKLQKNEATKPQS